MITIMIEGSKYSAKADTVLALVKALTEQGYSYIDPKRGYCAAVTKK